jgi:zinc protease
MSQAMSQVQPFQLDNGLKVLVKEDHRAPIVVAMIWYHVGSADEPGGITGASHVLEHLMFKGTKKYPLGVFSKTIADMGGQENAFTSNDYTAYYEKIASKNLALSLELEADRMHHLLLDKEEFGKEIRVIQEERRSRTDDNPQALTFERFLATAHLSAPYHHPVIGWMSDLQQMRVEDARAWYQRFYVPNNATLVVIGDVKAADVYRLTKKYFGHIHNRPLVERRPQKEPPHLGKKIVEIHRSAEIPMLMLGFTVPTVKTVSTSNRLDPYVLEIIASLLDAGDAARINSQLIHNTGVASDVDIFYNLYARYQTQFILYGSPSQNHTLLDLKKGILAELKRLQTEPVSAKELARVKTQIIAQKTFERDSIFGQAMELGLLETVGIGWRAAETYTDHINEVTAQHIQNVSQRYFQENNMTEARLIPDEKPRSTHSSTQ